MIGYTPSLYLPTSPEQMVRVQLWLPALTLHKRLLKTRVPS